jgi:pimeloyl-ACP methyl ester carboxylesterase
VDELTLAARGMTFRARAAGPEDGALVLLLHGFPQTSWEWHHQLEALAGAGYRAVAPDQRGYSPGARPAGVDAYRIDELVADALALADALGAHRFHLVGHDWGAIVAWHVAAKHPDRLASLTIVSVPHATAWSRAFAAGSGSDQAQRSQYFDMLRAPDAAQVFGGADGAGLRAVFDASGLAGHDVEPHLEVLCDPAALDAALNWYRAYDFHGTTLPDIVVRTLFVWSTEDPAIAREPAEWTAEHVTAPYRLVVLEGVGHWIPEVEAERFSALLLEHLAARASTSGTTTGTITGTTGESLA